MQKIDWTFLSCYSGVDEAVEKFYNVLYGILDKCIPYRKQNTQNYPCWFTWDIIKNIKTKNYHHKALKSKKGNVRFHRQKFNELRKEIKKEISRAYNVFITNAELSIQSDPSKFWSFIKSKTHHLNSTSLVYNGREITDNKEIANSFANYFESIYANNVPVNTNSAYIKFSRFDDKVNNINIHTIDLSEIQSTIRNLKPKKAIGPDGIPDYIVKGCAEFFILPLYILFNMTITSSTFPQKWKLTKVCPIPKCKKGRDISNYRPVSILSTFAKILESILYKNIEKHIRISISEHQHGFVQSRSTVTNLSLFSNFVTDVIDQGGQVDVIYTDFSKAFDKVNHEILLYKLRNLNFSRNLLKLFESYLKDRRQFTVYKGCKSVEYTQLSGVPQGSNLGPLLFTIFINDLPECIINSHKLLYADDLKIFRCINSKDDGDKLQQDVNAVAEWCKNNSLEINISKCNVISYTKRKNMFDTSYTLNNTKLKLSNTVKDLGVMYDNKLTFQTHIDTKINEANKNLGFILRLCKEFNNPKTLQNLYQAFVRPQLEYATIIWNPDTKKQILQIEKLQSKFLRCLTYRQTGFYPRMVGSHSLNKNYNMMTLEQRRMITDLQFLYKIFNNQIDCSELLSSFRVNVPGKLTRLDNYSYFAHKKSKSNIMKKSPTWRLSETYNIISKGIKDLDISADNFNLYRAKILNFMENVDTV